MALKCPTKQYRKSVQLNDYSTLTNILLLLVRFITVVYAISVMKKKHDTNCEHDANYVRTVTSLPLSKKQDCWCFESVKNMTLNANTVLKFR